ncbi:MAG: META domain-containing protein [Anaerolineae bacterium CFX3]|nr:hypothetical protein [Anaerolineales bacterium]MCE7904342.1 META domain-containing protein [Anaerolineae bacterium CFX3]MCQ3946156.1 hypothetical protein [Anaerolineae bacterium]RIK27575.1 MAG: hypothetical protein DCC54_02895 [Anaerolineae bacterium]
MKKSLLSLIVAFALTGILLSACSGGAPADVAGEWRLVSYGPVSNQKPVEQDTSITFSADGRFNGNLGCNTFGGSYKVSGAKIEFGAGMTTLMACQPPIDQQESAVLAVLADTAAFTLTGDTLTIVSADGSSSVRLMKK